MLSNLTRLSFVALALGGTAYAQGNTPNTAAPSHAIGALPFDTTPYSTSGFNGGGSCDGGASSVNKDGFWQWTAPAPGDYRFDTVGSSFDTKLSIHLGVGSAATCADYNDDTMGLQSEVNLLNVASGDQVLIQIGGYGSDFGSGVVTVTYFVDPCNSIPDDGFEDNDDCGTSTSLSNGSYAGLFVSKSDKDHYAFCVAAGATVNVDLLFTSGNGGGDIDCFLREATAPECGTGSGNNELAAGASATNNEHLVWTNNTGGDVDVVLEVNIFNLHAFNCNSYDMVIAGVDGCGGGGTTGALFCNPAYPNSTGGPTILAGSFGSGVGSDLHLECVSGVPFEFGYVLVGNMATPGIPVSQGLMCLVGIPGASVYRYNVSGTASNSIGQFDASGVKIGRAHV